MFNGEADEIPAGASSTETWINNFCGMWGLQRQFGKNFNLNECKVEEWMTSNTNEDMLAWTRSL
ncbi:hypothetical protein AGMMS49992_19170 [Clostridia bacterium]|nr:hypothetical protein AGMMS49992_19170 [Clostridia bacterium]